MHRLCEAGDRAGAKKAFAQADLWMGCYAKLAPSEREIAAATRERDRFRAQLAREFENAPVTAVA